MREFRRNFGSIYSDDEERMLAPWQRMRQVFFAPIAAILLRLGVDPDTISYTSVDSSRQPSEPSQVAR